MSSLQANFDELIERIRRGRELGHAGFEPIYYLVFEPQKILEVKRKTPAWAARLRNEGWEVHCFSIATEIEEILQHDLEGYFSQHHIVCNTNLLLAMARNNRLWSQLSEPYQLQGFLFKVFFP